MADVAPPPRESSCNWRRALIAILLFASGVIVFPRGFRVNVVGDAQPAELLPVSILREHDLDFDEFAPDREHLPFWFKEVNGRVISFYPIVPGLLNTPAYWIADRFGGDVMQERARLSMWTATVLSAGYRAGRK